jgi:hypothetical protein
MLAPPVRLWDIPTMNTLKVDAKRRIRLPEAMPEQVYIWEKDPAGRFILTLVKPEPKEAFPPGSLDQFINPARDREQLALLKGCTLEPQE